MGGGGVEERAGPWLWGGIWRNGLDPLGWALAVGGLGINPRTGAFLLLSCCVLAPFSPPVSLSVLRFSTFIALFQSLRLVLHVLDSGLWCLLGTPVEARDHADVFGAGVDRPPGNR